MQLTSQQRALYASLMRVGFGFVVESSSSSRSLCQSICRVLKSSSLSLPAPEEMDAMVASLRQSSCRVLKSPRLSIPAPEEMVAIFASLWQSSCRVLKSPRLSLPAPEEMDAIFALMYLLCDKKLNVQKSLKNKWQ